MRRTKKLMSLVAVVGTLGCVSAYAQNSMNSDQTQPNPPPSAPPNPPQESTPPNQPQEYTTPEQAQQTQPENGRWNLYHGCEFSVDAFGAGLLHSYEIRNGEFSRRNTRWGGGVGANFFLTKYFGVGGDFLAIASRNANTAIGNLTALGNVIFRYPIGETGLAPYAFGEMGCQFAGINQFVGGGGFGLEFRPIEHIGVFVDASWLAAGRTRGFGLGRAGIRLSF
jgi:hypothetical protein